MPTYGSRRSRLAVAIFVASLCIAGLASAILPATSAQSTVNVTINSFAFTPSTITVVIGVNNTVTWTNEQTGVTHTVTGNDGAWGSGDIASGSSFTYTFTTAGSFGYHCSIHTYMKGTVIVLSAGSSSTTATTSTSASTSTTTTSTASSTTSGSATTASSTPTTGTQTTTTSATGSSSTSSTSGGIPEFPYSVAAIATVSVLVVASYLLARRSLRAGGRPASPAMA